MGWSRTVKSVIVKLASLSPFAMWDTISAQHEEQLRDHETGLKALRDEYCRSYTSTDYKISDGLFDALNDFEALVASLVSETDAAKTPVVEIVSSRIEPAKKSNLITITSPPPQKLAR